jgi:hypothetical protein
MENQRWRLRIIGGIMLSLGAFPLLFLPVFGVIYREPRFFIPMISLSGWAVGGYVIIRGAAQTGKRAVGFLFIGLTSATITTLLGAFIMRLAEA